MFSCNVVDLRTQSRLFAGEVTEGPCALRNCLCSQVAQLARLAPSQPVCYIFPLRKPVCIKPRSPLEVHFLRCSGSTKVKCFTTTGVQSFVFSCFWTATSSDGTYPKPGQHVYSCLNT
ncbi:hypothetical protein C5167_023238 [Papaver somniferum]|uniref:Uncharacterized protein n=1 Tax=Papaver somniferum TaxID=3469 RepID=A0A4Y7JK46_PAPSO|nr:hypothetical protein C5167_023238 [Papaver somniferum]